MLLAVVLCFSALPFSVSADEVSSSLPSESTVESQPEESQAEETEEPIQADGIITISDSSGDVPVLRAQDPFTQVKNDVEGGTNYMTSVGVTRENWRPTRTTTTTWALPMLAATPNPPTGTPPTTAAPWG